jgi:MFS-type transporter involved in bile tolerance (Atg22 family)
MGIPMEKVHGRGKLPITPTTRRERWSWYFYDFGNSAYAAVVLLAVYAAYFKGEVVRRDTIMGNLDWYRDAGGCGHFTNLWCDC